ncbi:MAG: uncharacterized protein KVP18_003457 [Porospora cf. gigantea A]|uniref:uncharacterized protein n=1 Tax=Porospora cf. gigantea A TaxID=2853593 RepID=UPI003559BF59|nr:MAG: hypothetical protein KVP18_003457 [Porospora cf. gigantea A]
MLREVAVPGGVTALEAEDFSAVAYFETALETVPLEKLEKILQTAQTKVQSVLYEIVNQQYPDLVNLSEQLKILDLSAVGKVEASISLASGGVRDILRAATEIQSSFKDLASEYQQLTSQARKVQLRLESDCYLGELEATLNLLDESSNIAHLENAARLLHHCIRADRAQSEPYALLESYRRTVLSHVSTAARSLGSDPKQLGSLWRSATLLGASAKLVQDLSTLWVEKPTSGDGLSGFVDFLRQSKARHFSEDALFWQLYSRAAVSEEPAMLGLRCVAAPTVKQAAGAFEGVISPHTPTDFWKSYSVARGYIACVLTKERTLYPDSQHAIPACVAEELKSLEDLWLTDVAVSIHLHEANDRLTQAWDRFGESKPNLRVVSWLDIASDVVTGSEVTCWSPAGTVLSEILSLLRSKAADGRALLSSCIPRVIRGCCEMISAQYAAMTQAALAPGDLIEFAMRELLHKPSPDELEAHMAPLIAVGKELGDVLDTIGKATTQQLLAGVSEVLLGALAIPKLYVLTGKSAPTKVSAYVPHLLERVRHYLHVMTSEAILRPEVYDPWVETAIKLTVDEYAAVVRTVQDTSHRHDSTQRRLKGGERDVFKIWKQLDLDISGVIEDILDMRDDLDVQILETLRSKFSS